MTDYKISDNPDDEKRLISKGDGECILKRSRKLYPGWQHDRIPLNKRELLKLHRAIQAEILKPQ